MTQVTLSSKKISHLPRSKYHATVRPQALCCRTGLSRAEIARLRPGSIWPGLIRIAVRTATCATMFVEPKVNSFCAILYQVDLNPNLLPQPLRCCNYQAIKEGNPDLFCSRFVLVLPFHICFGAQQTHDLTYIREREVMFHAGSPELLDWDTPQQVGGGGYWSRVNMIEGHLTANLRICRNQGTPKIVAFILPTKKPMRTGYP